MPELVQLPALAIDASAFVYTTKAEALARHKELSFELAELHLELGTSMGLELAADVATTLHQDQTTDKQRERAVKVSKSPHTREVWRVRARIEAAKTELDDIRTQLAYGGLA